MIALARDARVFLAAEPADMRKSFDGLAGLVRANLDEDPLSGALFVFVNKRRTRMKVLHWDGTGLWVFAKRPDRGQLAWPKMTAGAAKVALSTTELAALLDGLEVSVTKTLRRWQPPTHPAA